MRAIRRGHCDRLLTVAVVGVVLTGCVAAPPPAAPPPPPPLFAAAPPPPPMPPHPHYLQALSDLRFARWLLNRPDEYNVVREQSHAVAEIDQAIGQIRQASIDDGQPPDAHPPIDARLDQRGRLRRAREVLASARRDLSFQEGNFAALGWRDAAIHHVDEAHRFVDLAIRDKHWDNQ